MQKNQEKIVTALLAASVIGGGVGLAMIPHHHVVMADSIAMNQGKFDHWKASGLTFSAVDITNPSKKILLASNLGSDAINQKIFMGARQFYHDRYGLSDTSSKAEMEKAAKIEAAILSKDDSAAHQYFREREAAIYGFLVPKGYQLVDASNVGSDSEVLILLPNSVSPSDYYRNYDNKYRGGVAEVLGIKDNSDTIKSVTVDVLQTDIENLFDSQNKKANSSSSSSSSANVSSMSSSSGSSGKQSDKNGEESTIMPANGSEDLNDAVNDDGGSAGDNSSSTTQPSSVNTGSSANNVPASDMNNAGSGNGNSGNSTGPDQPGGSTDNQSLPQTGGWLAWLKGLLK